MKKEKLSVSAPLPPLLLLTSPYPRVLRSHSTRRSTPGSGSSTWSTHWPRLCRSEALPEKIFMEERDCAAAFALVLNGNFATIASHATGIARSRKTPEKVFVLLDMLTAWEKERALAETLTSLGEHGGVAGQLASKVQEMYTMLVNSARDTYREFAMAVERDDVGNQGGQGGGHEEEGFWFDPNAHQGPSPDFGGASRRPPEPELGARERHHPSLTAYLIQYCRRLQQYPSASRILNRRATGTTREEGEDLAGRMISRLLHTLLKNLKIKVQRLSHGKQASDGQDAQHFADVFMLNNANYILSRARCFEHLPRPWSR